MDNKKAEKNYNLKSEAVETLVNADTEEAPQYSEEELAKYRSKSRIRISEPVKILFLKAWFSGAVCYFILWGLGTYLYSLIDMLFVLGIVQGLVTDLLLNNVIRFIEKVPGENDKWLLVTAKGMAGFFLNLIYGMVIIACVYGLYGFVNRTIIAITGAVDSLPLGVEPVMFGIFCMAVDMVFVGMKHLAASILSDAKAKADLNR